MARGLPGSIPVLPVAFNLVRTARRDRLSSERAEQVQARLLRRLVAHAVSDVPWWRERVDPAVADRVRSAADLPLLPVLDRAELCDRPLEAFLADGVSRDEVRLTTTSGSSGLMVTLAFSERDLGYLRASFLWDMLASGMRPTDAVAYFRSGPFRHHRLERLGIARNTLVDTKTDVDSQVAAFLASRADVVWGYPSSIHTVLEELHRRGIAPPRVRTAVIAGERATPATRAAIGRHLGATVHEVYAAVESYTVARTCPRGALHLRSTDVVAEVEHDDGSVTVADGEGELLVTRLQGHAMPVLRYRLGDRVAIGPNDCTCGVRHTPILHEVVGRVTDRLVTRAGRSRSADFLFNIVKDVPGVRQMQFVQAEPGAVDVLVVPGGRPVAEVLGDVQGALAGVQRDVVTTPRAVDRIEPEPNGKIRVVKRL